MRIRRFVDLSVPLVNAENGVAADPTAMIPEISYISHQAGAKQMVAIFPGLKPEDHSWSVSPVSSPRCAAVSAAMRAGQR